MKPARSWRCLGSYARQRPLCDSEWTAGDPRQIQRPHTGIGYPQVGDRVRGEEIIKNELGALLFIGHARVSDFVGELLEFHGVASDCELRNV
jgi:hypothetical protein